jgi:hypothetical protein
LRPVLHIPPYNISRGEAMAVVAEHSAGDMRIAAVLIALSRVAMMSFSMKEAEKVVTVLPE